MVNIAEKLKNPKKGTTLWSPLFGPVTLVDAGQMIYVNTNDGRPECFDENGRYFLKSSGCYSVDCLLFPGKDKTWGSVEIKRPYEPKYKLGDWVVYCGNVYLVIDISKTSYTFASAKTGAELINDIVATDNSSSYRLWRISDAISGDVLTDYADGLDNPLIFILKGFEHVDFGCKRKSDYSSYCFLKANTRQDFLQGKYHHKHDIKPATYEQLKLLFMKMDEAGYYWNEETKELLKYPPTKFNAGNWIIDVNHKYNLFYVSKALKDTYMMIDVNGVEFKTSRYTIEKDCRLWNIKDAQNGDVLAAHEVIVLFKEIDGLNIRTHFSYHYMNTPMVFTNDLHNKDAFSPATKDEREQLFKKIAEEGYKWDDNENELKKLMYNAGKFNVGDWITDGNAIAQICSIGNGWYLYGDRCILGDIKDVDKNYHLWSIEDAKVGDVLSNNNVICIFAGLDKDKNIFSPCMYTSQHGLEVFSSGEECMGSTLLRPATQKDCDILFSALDEAGYRWDENKCELVLLVKQRPKHNDKKNKHYDIASFYAGMEVLVRDDNDEEWNYLHFSHYRKKLSEHFFAGGNPWFQCIPFNNETKHLLGTTDMPSEEYINW